MFKFVKPALLVIMGASLSFPLLAADKPYVTVNGTPVSQEMAKLFIAEQTTQGAQDTPELRGAVREELVRRQLLVQEARKANLEKRPQVAAQIEAARQVPLVRAYIQDYLQKNPISDAQLKAEYDKVAAQMGNTEYKARHILVATEDEAKAIITGLKKGEKFEELAKKSIDPSSKDTGGDLGWMTPAAFVKPFSEALTSLSKGKYSETPVKTDYGYHVILLEDTRPLTPPKFEELKPRLMQQAQGQQVNKLIEGLRAKAKVE